MPSLINSFYDFGEFRLDPQNRVLRRGQELIQLSPKALEVLLVLVQSNGSVITKDELMKAVWPDSFVEESNLTQTIFILRKALHETPEERYILTVQGRGYRFVPTVTLSGQEVPAPDVTPVPSHSFPAPDATQPPSSRRKSRLLLTASLCVIVLAAVIVYLRVLRPRGRPVPARREMLAVLPFENLTGDPTQEYFSDGLTEEMIADLGNLDPEHLGVIARTSVMHYKNGHLPVNQIGRELEVQYVLEGSVRRDADKVRVTAQLIAVKGQRHLWARQYDRELRSVLNVQGEIAQEVADEIHLTLGDHAKPAKQQSLSEGGLVAYDFYLRGRYFWNKRTPQGFAQSIIYFNQAIAADPSYARAYAGLADTYALMSAYSVAPPDTVIPQARTAALKALALDEKLAEAHVSLAVIAQNYDWDWETAEKEYRRAIELDPNYATGHHWYAEHLALRGRFDEAFVEMKRALELDPLSLIIQADNGAILYFARQYDRSIEQFRAVLDMEPNFPRASIIVSVYAQKGEYAEALKVIENRPHAVADFSWSLSMRAYIYSRSGEPAQARRALQEMQVLDRRTHLDPLDFVIPYAALGDTDQALAWLDKSLAAHSPAITALKVDPAYDPLRADPRFQQALRTLHLDK